MLDVFQPDFVQIMTIPTEQLSQHKTDSVTSQFSIASILLIITLAALLFAVFAAAPGFGILLALAAMPPLVRTCMVVNRRKSLGSSVSPQSKMLLFLSSLATTGAIAIVSLFVAFSTFCFSLIGVVGLINDVLPWQAEIGLSMIGAAIPTILTVMYMVKLQKNRWQRDIGQIEDE